MSKPDGGPAFPVLHETCQRINESEMYSGMTLRDYYKGQALIGLANRLTDERFEHLFNGTQGGMKEAIVAGVLADAMLQEREK